jgi:hypothetical protein
MRHQKKAAGGLETWETSRPFCHAYRAARGSSGAGRGTSGEFIERWRLATTAAFARDRAESAGRLIGLKTADRTDHSPGRDAKAMLPSAASIPAANARTHTRMNVLFKASAWRVGPALRPGAAAGRPAKPLFRCRCRGCCRLRASMRPSRPCCPLAPLARPQPRSSRRPVSIACSSARAAPAAPLADPDPPGRGADPPAAHVAGAAPEWRAPRRRRGVGAARRCRGHAAGAPAEHRGEGAAQGGVRVVPVGEEAPAAAAKLPRCQAGPWRGGACRPLAGRPAAAGPARCWGAQRARLRPRASAHARRRSTPCQS